MYWTEFRYFWTWGNKGISGEQMTSIIIVAFTFQKLFKHNQISCLFKWDGGTNCSPCRCGNVSASQQFSHVGLTFPASLKPGMDPPRTAQLITVHMREKQKCALGQSEGPDLEPGGFWGLLHRPHYPYIEFTEKPQSCANSYSTIINPDLQLYYNLKRLVRETTFEENIHYLIYEWKYKCPTDSKSTAPINPAIFRVQSHNIMRHGDTSL